jgi:hypothetical protein
MSVQFVTLDIVDAEIPSYRQISTSALTSKEQITANVCTVEVTVSEKLLCVVTRADENTRSKDIWDLFTMIPICEPKKLRLVQSL